MRLLLVGTNPNARGTEQHLVTLGRQLHAEGHTIAVAAAPGGFIHDSFRAAGIQVFDARIRNSLDVASVARLIRSGHRFRPDWMVGWFGKEYWPLLAAARRLGVPVALFKHLYPRMSPLTRRFVPRLADRFIVVSEAMRQAAIGMGVPGEYVDALPNPVDVDLFRPNPSAREAMRAELKIAPDEVVVGFVGNLHAGKGIYPFADALNAAMAADPRIRALWVGSGQEQEQLIARLQPATRDRHLLLLGYRTDIHRCYAAMDVVAVPSTEMESFSRVSIEGQACGVPVLGSRLGGIPETMREGETGILLPPGDVAAWRDAILDLVRRGPAARRAMGAAGARFVVEHFSAPVITTRFLDLLRNSRRSVA
jgi:glycosyltransferase involved in cell wall biosynthesis